MSYMYSEFNIYLMYSNYTDVPYETSTCEGLRQIFFKVGYILVETWKD